jgi:hypothetical protein
MLGDETENKIQLEKWLKKSSNEKNEDQNYIKIK